MSISNAQYLAWLADPTAIRIVLIEANVRPAGAGADVTRYLSTGNYVTGATNTGTAPAHQFYLPMAVANLSVTESITIDGDASMSIGDIEIHNLAGERDSWLGDVWVNRQVQAFIGDARWDRVDFRMIFNGVIADVASKSRDKINLKLRDKLQRLNNAVSETKLGGTTTNRDAVVPVLMGEGFNLTPLTVGTNQFQYSLVAAQGLSEVRDSGIPIANDIIGWARVTSTPSTGKFTVIGDIAGVITCDAQGDATGSGYTNNISLIIQRLATNFGKSVDRFVTADLDTTQLAAFAAANTQPVGIYLNERTNVLNACQDLASSVGARVVMSRLGQMQLLRVDLSALSPTFDIKPYHMVDRNIYVGARTEVAASAKLNFCRNYTPQSGLTTALSATDKELFGLEWLSETYVDATAQALYKLSADPVEGMSQLLCRTDANTEVVRRVNLKKVARTTYMFEAYSELLQLTLGQHVRVYHPRFNLSAGVAGMVVSLTPNWSTGHVIVGVMI